MSTERYMDLAREISEKLKVIPKTNQFQFKIRKQETKFKATVAKVAQVYPTAEEGSDELATLMRALDNVDASLSEIQTDINHDTTELRDMIQSSAEVIEKVKKETEKMKQDPDAILSADAMYDDKTTLYQVGYVNMWVKIVLCALLILLLFRSFTFIVLIYVCVCAAYFVIQAIQYVFTKYPASTTLAGTPEAVPVEPVEVDCADTEFQCCLDGVTARTDRKGTNCPGRCPPINNS